MDLIKKLEQIAIELFLPILRASNQDNRGFKCMLSMDIDGEVKPLLLFGSAHGKVEDGHVSAVLNPDKELCDRLVPGCGYTIGILRHIAAKRCDALVHLGVSAYRKNPIDYAGSYRARYPRPAKFSV